MTEMILWGDEPDKGGRSQAMITCQFCVFTFHRRNKFHRRKMGRAGVKTVASVRTDHHYGRRRRRTIRACVPVLLCMAQAMLSKATECGRPEKGEGREITSAMLKAPGEGY